MVNRGSTSGVKGGGGAHTREKILALAAERFVVIVSADKLVDELTPPIPLELLASEFTPLFARLAPRCFAPPREALTAA
jgi:ribose 5-phosphate isomerase A